MNKNYLWSWFGLTLGGFPFIIINHLHSHRIIHAITTVLKFDQAVISYGSLEILWNQFHLFSAEIQSHSSLNRRFTSIYS